MAHIHVDYSANLEPEVDFSALCHALLDCARGIAALPTPGLRVRAVPAPHFAIADGDAAHGYVDISVRLRAGRPMPVKAAATEALFAAARDFLAPVMAARSLALSLEMREIEPALAPRAGTIRAHMAGGS